MGWEQLLDFRCDKIYMRVVIQWVSSLSRNGDELTGIVGGKAYTITPSIVRDLFGVDTRTDLPYEPFNEAEYGTTSDENKRKWVEACKTVFGQEEISKQKSGGYEKSKMTPVVQILWRIGLLTFSPRLVNENDSEIYEHEIYLLHTLFTGDYLYSFAHLMINDIWDMYEHEHPQNIPHAYYISEILNRLGAVSEDEYADVIPPQCRLITRSSFHNLKFSESSTEYIIDDRMTSQRVTFPKKARVKQAPFRDRPTQMHLPNPQLDMAPLLTNLQNLVNMQSSQSQKQLSEMMTMITNIQKQMDSQALEAGRREQERERQAEVRAHAIIWDMERHRYFYEKEQEQLHKAWDQAYGSDEFQFPQITHISFHPPQAGSSYYDSSQGDEMPKAFQDIFHDIYGTRR